MINPLSILPPVNTLAPTESLPRFVRAQLAFTAHIRSPATAPCPADVEDRRMAIYRDLFFNNVEGFVSNCFPVLRSLVSDQDWRILVRDFYARHISHSPLFSEIPAEFLAYLEQEKPADLVPDFPFLLELAHYEWLELVAQIATDELPAAASLDVEANTRIGLSPLAFVQGYQFPVQHIGPAQQALTAPAEPSLLVVYRNRLDKVQFLALNPLSYQLLQQLADVDGIAAGELLHQLAATLKLPRERVLPAGLCTLADFVQRDIVLVLP